MSPADGEARSMLGWLLAEAIFQLAIADFPA